MSLRVLEVVKGLNVGGAEVLLVNRLSLSDRQSFDYRVAFLDPTRTGLVSQLTDQGIPVWCLEGQQRWNWAWVRNLRSYLKHERIDVVHVHSPLMAAGVRAAVRTLGSARPSLVSTAHSIDYHPATAWVTRATVRLDDAVIAVSNAVARSAPSRHARELLVVHHGIPLARARTMRQEREQLAERLGLKPGSPRILTVANYRPEKGHKALVEAARIVHAARPDAQFITVGHGPLEARVRAEVRSKGMDDYFSVLGQQPEAVRYTACADVFVLPSDREGRPVALMEAMGCGVASVASAVGGVPDMITDGQNGLLVPPGDPDALAHAILRVLASDELRSRLETGAAGDSNHYDMAGTAQEIERLYKRVARRRADQTELGS